MERWIKNRGELQAAVEFTAAKTGFQPALVEKDFWCSVVLGRIYAAGNCPLVFKGGTLLSKAYAAFNRLSEDLDFTLPTGPEIKRSARSKRAREIAAAVERAAEGLLEADVEGWRSFNNSTQQRVALRYASVFGAEGTISLEIGQREEPMEEIAPVPLATLLRDPLFDEEAVLPVQATSLSRTEAYAEKCGRRLPGKIRLPAICSISIMPCSKECSMGRMLIFFGWRPARLRRRGRSNGSRRSVLRLSGAGSKASCARCCGRTLSRPSISTVLSLPWKNWPRLCSGIGQSDKWINERMRYLVVTV